MATEDLDIDDTMQATLDDIKSRDDDEVEEEIEAEAPEAPEEEPEEIEAAAEEVEEEPEEEEPADPYAANPPSSWRAGAKAKWDAIDPSIKAEVVKREHDMAQGVQHIKQEMERYREGHEFSERMNKTLEPYAPLIRAENATPEQVVQNMLNSAYILRQGSLRDKVNMTVQLAQQYGYLNELKGLLFNNQLPQQQAAPPGISPQDVERLVQEKLAAQQQAAKNKQLEQEVQQFVAATDEKGRQKYPYVNNVWREMAALLETAESDGRDLTLEAAYNQALWANDETRPLVMSQQAQNGVKTGKDRVEKAKKASQNNVRSKASHQSSQPTPTGSIDDTLRETMENIRARSA